MIGYSLSQVSGLASKAYLDNGGVKGTVTFETGVNDIVTAKFALSGVTLSEGTFTVEVREFPLNKDSGNWCNEAEIGNR